MIRSRSEPSVVLYTLAFLDDGLFSFPASGEPGEGNFNSANRAKPSGLRGGTLDGIPRMFALYPPIWR